MLSVYLTDRAIYEPRIGANDRGEPDYGPPVILKARWRLTRQQIILPDQRQIKIERTYYLPQEIREGDRLDGLIVQLVEPWRNLAGNVLGCKAVT